MTDLGTLTLNNIFGIQDSETLDNFLHNVPNIVPKKDSLLSPADAPVVSPAFPFPLPSGSAATPHSSNLESIPEISPKQVDIHMSRGPADTNRASGSSTSSKSSHSKSERHSKNGGLARSSEGYSNPCLVGDSPNSPGSMLSTEGDKGEEYAKRTKYSVFGNDIDSSPANGPRAAERESSSSGKGAQRTKSLDKDSISDDTGTPKREGNDVLSPAVSEISLSQTTTTLQTFLKNLSEKNTELADALRSSSVEALDLQQQVGHFARILGGPLNELHKCLNLILMLQLSLPLIQIV